MNLKNGVCESMKQITIRSGGTIFLFAIINGAKIEINASILYITGILLTLAIHIFSMRIAAGIFYNIYRSWDEEFESTMPNIDAIAMSCIGQWSINYIKDVLDSLKVIVPHLGLWAQSIHKILQSVEPMILSIISCAVPIAILHCFFNKDDRVHPETDDESKNFVLNSTVKLIGLCVAIISVSGLVLHLVHGRELTTTKLNKE